MSKLLLKDYNLILNILDSVEKIQAYSGKFNTPDSLCQDSISFDATMMNFIVIGEMVDKISDELKENQDIKID